MVSAALAQPSVDSLPACGSSSHFSEEYLEVLCLIAASECLKE